MTAADHSTKFLMTAFAAVIIASLLLGIAGNWYFLVGVPLVFLLTYVAIVDFKKLFILILFLLPLTVEFSLPLGVDSDLPTEPMMVLLMGLFVVFLLRTRQGVSSDFIRHPITLALLVHLGWMFVVMLQSSSIIVSLKFFLAKTWYVTTFYFLAAYLLRKEQDFKMLLWAVLTSLLFTVFYIAWGHSAYGFSFADINKVVGPFYRNKVAFACMLSLFLPFVWFGRSWYQKYSWQWWLLLGAVVIMLAGVQISYTRAAFLSIAIAIGSYYIIRMRLMRIALSAAILTVVVLLTSLLADRAWLDMKPRYEKAITHEEFNDLLSATAKGEDISTMERVYRWVAGGHMVTEKPVFGFGSGTFKSFYKSYTVTGFTTYVSANEEGSGIHSYYLMTLVEQGFPGLIFFLALLFIVLLKGESIYHQTHDKGGRLIVMSAMLCFIIIASLLIVNDLVETDKIGSFFFMCMALLVNQDIKNRKLEETT